jgi:hypothetical protein
VIAAPRTTVAAAAPPPGLLRLAGPVPAISFGLAEALFVE